MLPSSSSAENASTGSRRRRNRIFMTSTRLPCAASHGAISSNCCWRTRSRWYSLRTHRSPPTTSMPLITDCRVSRGTCYHSCLNSLYPADPAFVAVLALIPRGDRCKSFSMAEYSSRRHTLESLSKPHSLLVHSLIKIEKYLLEMLLF